MTFDMHYGASAKIFQNAEGLRKNMTDAEKRLWERLRKNQLGVRFRNQHPLSTFVADFYCHELKFVIELDGEIHLAPENKEYDVNRNEELESLGIFTMRIENNHVINDIDQTIEEIKIAIQEQRRSIISKDIKEHQIRRNQSPL